MTEINLDQNSSLSEIKKYEKQLKSGYWINRYHATWCGHCQNMSEEWNKFINSKKISKINMSSVEEQALNQLEKQPENFKGFPTIQIINNGKLISEFNQERTASNLNKFVKENCLMLSNKKKKSLKKRNNNKNKKRDTKSSNKKRNNKITINREGDQ
jgi:thiol-disulfide isomerase/thioredoxin